MDSDHPLRQSRNKLDALHPFRGESGAGGGAGGEGGERLKALLCPQWCFCVLLAVDKHSLGFATLLLSSRAKANGRRSLLIAKQCHQQKIRHMGSSGSRFLLSIYLSVRLTDHIRYKGHQSN